MRELTNKEIQQVGGADIFSSANIASATRLVRGLGYLGGAFSAGWTIGTALYNSGLDELIADALEAMEK
jgi:hypothetical protein